MDSSKEIRTFGLGKDCWCSFKSRLPSEGLWEDDGKRGWVNLTRKIGLIGKNGRIHWDDFERIERKSGNKRLIRSRWDVKQILDKNSNECQMD